MVGEVEAVEAADARLAAWQMMENSSLYRSSHTGVERWQGALGLEVLRASVVEGQPRILVENLNTDHEAWRVARGVGRCCLLA